MKRSWILLVLLLVGVVGWYLWNSNAKPPTEEMAQAENAVLAAENAGADVYAAEDYNAAADALADARANMVSEDYSEAKEAAMDATAKAVVARTNAEIAAEAWKRDTARQWAALQIGESKLATLKDNQGAVRAATLKIASKLQGNKAANLKKELADLEAALATVQIQLDQRNAALAMAKAEMSADDLADLEHALANLEAAMIRQDALKMQIGLAAMDAALADAALKSTAGMGTITGTVKFTKEPDAPRITQLMKGVMVSPNDGIKGVTVSLVGENTFTTMTDDEGNFSLVNVPPGDHEIQSGHPQLGKQDTKVPVFADRLSKVNFSYFYWSR